MLYLIENIFLSILTIFFLHLSSSELHSQISSEKNVLAEIGDNYILKQEFENRLNFYPKEGVQDKINNQGIKKELLYTLIAEKMWSNYALETGYDAKLSVITAKNVIEKMFIRDELYKSEIKEKTTITDEDYRLGEFRFEQILELMVFYSENKRDFEIVNETLKNGMPDSNFFYILQPQIQSKRITASFGDLPVDIENVVYGLDIGEYTVPLKLDNGWGLFYLEDRFQKKYKDDRERIESYKSFEKIISGRKEESRYNIFHEKFFKGKEVDADGGLFVLIARKISEIFTDKYNKGIFTRDKQGNDLIILDSEDIKLIESELDSAELYSSFIRFKTEPIDLITFLREISFQSFSVSSPTFENVKIQLNEKIKEFIKREMIAREGYKRGLDQAADVKQWVKIWYDNFLYQAIRNDVINNTREELNKTDLSNKISADIIDTFNESDAYKYFVEKTIALSDKYEININQELFEEIALGNINLFVIRKLGFGGSIAAVPSSPPFIDWYIAKQKREIENL